MNEGNAAAARRFSSELTQYALLLTRDISAARVWLRQRKRGGERIGLLASSNGAMLKPHGIFVKSKIEPTKWFLSESEDIRFSDSLEDDATEFDVPGLELELSLPIGRRRQMEHRQQGTAGGLNYR